MGSPDSISQTSSQPIDPPVSSGNIVRPAPSVTTGAGRKFDGAPVSHLAPAESTGSQPPTPSDQEVKDAKARLAFIARELVQEVASAATGIPRLSNDVPDDLDIKRARWDLVEAEYLLSASLGDSKPKEIADTANKAWEKYHDLLSAGTERANPQMKAASGELLAAATAWKADAEFRGEPTALADKYIDLAQYELNPEMVNAKDDIKASAKTLGLTLSAAARHESTAAHLPGVSVRDARESVARAERRLSASVGDTKPKELADSGGKAWAAFQNAKQDLQQHIQATVDGSSGSSALTPLTAKLAEAATTLLAAATAMRDSAESRGEPTDEAEQYIADAKSYLPPEKPDFVR